MVRRNSVPGSLTRVVLLFLLLCVAADSRGEVFTPGLSSDVSDQVIQSQNAFGFTLFEELIARSESGANVVIAPSSIAMALTMAYNGTDGTTKEAMGDVLGLKRMLLGTVNESCRDINRYLETWDTTTQFTSAHSMWVDRGFQIGPRFRSSVARSFSAKVAALDFGKPGAVDTINTWVAANTDGEITDVLDQIPASVVMYLVNAIYFKGDWKHPFSVDRTKQAPFTLADGSTVMCDMMTSSLLRVQYFDGGDGGYRMVELPYGEGSFVATIVLPEPDTDLDGFIAALDVERWGSLVAELRTDVVRVSLPRFVLRSHFELNDALSTVGMGVAFDPREADFSLMSQHGEKDLWISRVIHGAAVEVDEQGTEAGAATAVGIGKGPAPETIAFDRPFLFVIRDTNSGSIQFLAKVSDPTE